MYFGALNTTKVPESDMLSYIDMFNSVPHNGYANTLLYNVREGSAAKDLGYSSLVYVLYYVLFGNSYLFIFMISSIIFLFYFIAIYKIGVEYNLPAYLIVSELIVIAFFSQYFSLTFHLVRQELATSLFFYALTFRTSSIKSYIVWCVVASLMHSAIIVIVLFSFVPFIKQELTIRGMAVLVGIAIFFFTLASTLGTFILDNYELEGTVEYNVARITQMSGAQDKVKSSGILYIFSLGLLSLSAFEMIRNKGNVVYPLIVNLCFIWCVLVLGMAVSPLLQYRFYFIEFNFLPFLGFLLFRHNPKLLKAICFCTVSFLMVRFYASLNNVFQYATIEEALAKPFFLLLRVS